MTPEQRRRWGLAARVVLTAAILAAIAVRVDLGRLWQDLRTAAPWGLAGVAALALLNFSLQWARLTFVARIAGQGLTAGQTSRMVLAGISLGLVTPGGMGEMGRGLSVAGDHDSVAVAGLTGLERSFSFAGSVGIAIVAMIASRYGTVLKWTPIVTGYALVLFMLMHPYRLAALMQRLMPRLPAWTRERTTGFMNRFLKGWEMAGRRAALVVLVISVVQTLVALTQMTLCYFTVCGQGPWLKVFGAWAVVLGAKHFLPITVGDIGVREGLALAVFADRQLLTSPALVAALLIYAVNVLAPALLGTLVLARRRARA